MAESAPVGQRCAYLFGNGRYAQQTYEELVQKRKWKAINLLPDDESQIHRPEICMYNAVFEPGRLIAKLKELGVTQVVFAGDLGNVRFSAREVVMALSRYPKSNTIFLIQILRRNLSFRLVSVLQAFADILASEGIQPLHAASVIPELKPAKGPMNAAAEKICSRISVAELVDAGLPNLNQQPKSSVRQAVVLDDLQHLLGEEENTTRLLTNAKAIPKPDGAVRTLLKLAPSGLNVNIDAPVIGEDTIAAAAQAHVDLIVVDVNNGIIAQPRDTIAAAELAGIGIYGYQP